MAGYRGEGRAGDVAHGDDLDNGEEDRRRYHGGWELQH